MSGTPGTFWWKHRIKRRAVFIAATAAINDLDCQYLLRQSKFSFQSEKCLDLLRKLWDRLN